MNPIPIMFLEGDAPPVDEVDEGRVVIVIVTPPLVMTVVEAGPVLL